MPQPNTDDSVSDDEWLMRRIPAGPQHFMRERPAESPLGVTWLAFKPIGHDAAGISLSRLHSTRRPDFLTAEAFAALACAGKPPEKRIYVAFLRAKELTDPDGLAFTLKPDPQPGDPGHVLVPTFDTGVVDPRRRSFAITLAREFCHRVLGPFNCNGLIAAEQIDWRRQ